VLAGGSYLLRGFGLWRRRPGLMALGMLPALIVFVVLATGLVLLALNLGDLASWLTPFADDWADTARTWLRLGVAVVVLVAALALVTVSFTGLTLMVGDPFYERIWRETELMLGGAVPEGDLGLGRAIRDGAVVIAIGAATGAVVLALGFVPVIGAVAGAVLGFAVAGRVLAAELIARPLEARGLDRAARKALLRPHRSRVLGFGLATQVFFLVPLGAIVVMPAAVVGATMLAREVLGERPALSGRGQARTAPGAS
jgi:CysZ protein